MRELYLYQTVEKVKSADKDFLQYGTDDALL